MLAQGFRLSYVSPSHRAGERMTTEHGPCMEKQNVISDPINDITFACTNDVSWFERNPAFRICGGVVCSLKQALLQVEH
jgi:hypothetical protein